MPQPPRGSAPEREGAQRGVPTRRGFATGVNPDQLSASSAGSGRRARRARPPHPVRGGVAPRPAGTRLPGAGRDPGSVSTSRRLGSRPHGPSAKAWSSVPLRTARLDGDGPDHPAGPQPTDEEHGETNGERHGSRRFGVEVPRRDTDRDRHEGAGQGEGGEDSHRGSRPGHHGGDALSDRPASTDNIGHRRHRGCQWRTQRLAERPGRRDQAEVVGPQRLRVGGPHGSDGLAALRGQAQCVCRPATATHRSATATSRPATATERSATATERSAGNPGRSTGRSTLGKGTRGNQPQRRRRRQSGPECRCESVKEIQRLRLGFHRRPTGASRSSRLCCPPDQPGSGRRTRSCRQHVGSVPVSPQHQPGGHREQQRHHQCGHDDPPMASIDLASPVVPRRAESRGHPGPQGEPSRSVERAANTSGRPSGPRTTTPTVST